MKHLSGLDASFLHLETPEMPMHVASLDLLDLPPGYQGDYLEDVKRHMAQRLHRAEVFTRKLALMPFELSNPVWVDDEDIDLDYHLRHLTLRKPGTMKQLETLVARLHSSLLDRSRPLWEYYVIEGLQSGQVALYCKIHHAGVDGAAAIALLNAVMDVTPTPREVKPPRPKTRTNRYQLGVAEMLQAALLNTAQQFAKLLSTLPAAAQALLSFAKRQRDEAAPAAAGESPALKLLSPKTPFNVPITNQRCCALRSMPLAEAKAIAKQIDVKLNDVVLAVCAGALRRYLLEHNTLPRKPLTAAVPVSLRMPGDTEQSNQVSITRMTLATDVEDRVERLRAIAAHSSGAKNTFGAFRSVMLTDFPSLGAPWVMTGLANLYGRSQLASSVPPLANVLVSNNPGPQVALYFAGARMTHFYPVSIPGHGMALNITVNSYDGHLDYGLIACRRAVPDLELLADMMVQEHAKLRDAVAVHVAAQAPTTTASVSPAPPALPDLAHKSAFKPAGLVRVLSDEAPAVPPAVAPAAPKRRQRAHKPLPPRAQVKAKAAVRTPRSAA